MTRLRQLVDLARLVWLTLPLRTRSDAPAAEWVAIDDAWLEWVPGSPRILEQRRRHLERWVNEGPKSSVDRRRAWVTANTAYRVHCLRRGRQPMAIRPGGLNPPILPARRPGDSDQTDAMRCAVFAQDLLSPYPKEP